MAGVRPPADPVAIFLAGTFRCEHFRARLTPERCAARQEQPVEKGGGGTRARRYDTTGDRYCRSGACEQGRLVKLGVPHRRASPPRQPAQGAFLAPARPSRRRPSPPA